MMPEQDHLAKDLKISPEMVKLIMAMSARQLILARARQD